MGSSLFNNVAIAIIASAVPGILVALLAHQLDQQREERTACRLNANGRTLIALEIDGNRKALGDYWTAINALDKEGVKEREPHLAAMAQNGLSGITPPHWSVARWEGTLPGTIAALGQQEVVALDQMYRDLRTITDLQQQLITFTPQEQEQLNHDRFWYNRMAFFRWTRSSASKPWCGVCSRRRIP